MQRLLDILFSLTAVVVAAPLLAAVAVAVWVSTGAPILFRQQRVGRGGKPFWIYKYRTMRSARRGETALEVTVAGDRRVTPVGRVLRKTKLDELPQLWNVLRGDMSLVGPRPETPRYVALYTDAERLVLSVRPGLTDYASLEFLDEERLLAGADDPESHYREVVMREKLRLNLRYLRNPSLASYLHVLVRTAGKVLAKAFASEAAQPLTAQPAPVRRSA